MLFLGIDVLKDAFSGLPNEFAMPVNDGLGDVLTKVGIGIGLTVLMQSSAAELALEASRAAIEDEPNQRDAERAAFDDTARALLVGADPAALDMAGMHTARRTMEAAYQAYKGRLLADGAQGRLPVVAMGARLRAASAMHRALEQTAKAAVLAARATQDAERR